MNDPKERTDRCPVPDCPECFRSPEPDRNNRGPEGRKKQRYCCFPAGTKCFCCMPLYREMTAAEVANQGRDITVLFQPNNIRGR